MTQKTFWKLLGGVCMGLLAFGAQAANVLLYSDSDIYDTDDWGKALAGQAVTRVTSDASFNSLLSNGGFDLVVVQFNADNHSVSLSGYLGQGGKLIYSDWSSDSDSLLGVTQIASNEKNLTITSSALSAGLSSAFQTLDYEGEYGTFSRTLSGGSTLASLGNGAGIVRNGNIIINGFIGDTFAKSSDEIQLYKNEVNLLLAPVPEPDSYAMLLAGLGLMGWMARRRSEKLDK